MTITLEQNAVVMSNGTLSWDDESTWTGMIDRSPCGTGLDSHQHFPQKGSRRMIRVADGIFLLIAPGTCAVMAVLHAKGQLGLDEPFVHESIVGTTFTGRLTNSVTVGERSGVICEVTGRAWITQYCSVVLDPSDPFPQGFTVSDIWSA